MRRGFSHMDLEEIIGLSQSHCGVIFFTWVRAVSKSCHDLDDAMLVSAERQNKNKPACFSPFKNLRFIWTAHISK